MKLVDKSICPQCGESTLAVIAVDDVGEGQTTRCEECRHTWPAPALNSGDTK